MYRDVMGAAGGAATRIGHLVVEELDSIIAQFTGLWNTQHNDDGSHGDITARSLTLTKDAASGATGAVVADGDGTFDGNVTADADATGAQSGPVIIGTHPILGSVRPGPGIDIQGTPRWRILGFDPGSSDRELLFQDVSGGAPYSWLVKWRNALSAYVLHPEVTNPFHLGLDGPGTRIAKLFITRASIYESGSSAAMGEWENYTPVWTGTTTNPTLGNGTLVGRSTLIGKTVKFEIFLKIGSTTTAATGLWHFTIPQTKKNDAFVGYGEGSCVILDSSAAQYYLGTLLYNTTQILGMVSSPAVANSHINPMAVGTNDEYFFAGSYEMA